MSKSNVILVAFDVTAPDRRQAQDVLKSGLQATRQGPGPFGAVQYVESWWIAEDDRTDGSDSDSAVFVNVGEQERAAAVLHHLDLTSKWNVVERPGSDERWEDSLDWHAPNAESIPSGAVLADALRLVLSAAEERAGQGDQDEVRAALDLLMDHDVTAALQLDEEFCEVCADPSPNQVQGHLLCEDCTRPVLIAGRRPDGRLMVATPEGHVTYPGLTEALEAWPDHYIDVRE